MSTGMHRERDDMPAQIRESIDRIEQIEGRTPPVNEAEAYSDKVSRDTDYQFDSIMDDAYLGAAADADTEREYSDPKQRRLEEEFGHSVNRNTADDPRVVEKVTGEEERALEQ